MKIYITFFLLLPMLFFGQTQDQNYVKTTTYKVAGLGTISSPTPEQAKVDISYCDELGRPVSQVASKQSNSGKDIVTAIEHDVFGRQTKEYLPYVYTESLGYNLKAQYQATYGMTIDNPFSEKLMEPSPLSPVLKQTAPGADWAMGAGHEIKFDYQINNASEVKLYKAATSWNAGSGLYDIAFSDAGSYAANQLYKTVTYDENTAATPTETEGSTVEFKNKDGQVVLKRTYDNTVKHDTYYVYDNNGNLTYVLPPLVSNKLVQGSAPAGYDNFFKSFDQSVFTGIAGTGEVTVSITNNVLNIAFDTSVNTATLLETPQDLLTSPCLLPDMSLGTALNGKYEVKIVGGKLKFQLSNPQGPSESMVSYVDETLTAYLSSSYANFSKGFDYPVFTGNTGGGGGLTVSITNNVLTVRFNAGFTATELVETPLDLLTTPLLPDMTIGTILNGKYGVSIIGGKFKLTNLTKFPNGLRKTANLPNACKALVLLDNFMLKDELFYQYKYDSRNRLVEKKLPGKQWEYIVYDKLDRVVATGPAFSPFTDSAAGVVGWMITKYDAFNRPIYTGWEQSTTVTSAGRTAKQNTINGLTTLSESKTAAATIIDNLTGIVYYTNNVVPTVFKLLTVNYYDDYTFQAFTPAIAYTAPVSYNNSTLKPKGLPTGSWVRVLTTLASPTAESSYILYDAKARPIKSFSTNFLGGYTQTDSNLDAFSGKLLSTETRHKRLFGDAELLVKEVFTYSPQDRLLTHTHQINNGTIELMSDNGYDELGRLISKGVGNTVAAPVQKVNYAYNIRGWLTEINDITSLAKAGAPKDLFAFKLNYNGAPNIAGGKALYNGNIAETFWVSASETTPLVRGYAYLYDNLNRLKTSIFKRDAVVNNAYSESLNYDKNGNITSLIRNGNSDTAVNQIDNLTYSYRNRSDNISNRLYQVTDTAPAAYKGSGFKDAENEFADDYDYDANGNLIKDNPKNIAAITYNHLNLPSKITFGIFGTPETGNITYIYNALGQKVQKTVSVNTPASTTVTDYLGGYQYKKVNAGAAALQFFPTTEGYVEAVTPSSFKYVYQYKDHLGNVRLSYDKNLVIQEENNYYPFGLKQEGYNIVKNSTNDALKYKYNGKEFQDDNIGGVQLNLYDYGARNYDPALGRWMNIDPLAEQSRRYSPYNYALNNPIFFIDPDGMRIDNFYFGTFVSGEDVEREFRKLKSEYGGSDNSDGADGEGIDPPKPGTGTRTGNMQGHLPNGAPNDVDLPREELKEVVIKGYKEPSYFQDYFDAYKHIEGENPYSPYVPDGYALTFSGSVDYNFTTYSASYSFVLDGHTNEFGIFGTLGAGVSTSTLGGGFGASIDILDTYGGSSLFEGLKGLSKGGGASYDYLGLSHYQSVYSVNGQFKKSPTGVTSNSLLINFKPTIGANYGVTTTKRLF